MKTLLLSALLFAAGSSAFAQGQLIFQNNAATTITNCLTGLPAAGGAAQNDTQVGLYLGNVGDPLSSLQLIGVTNCNNPGRFAGGTRTLAGWTGTVQLQVRAWLATTVYPSYEAAFAAALGGDASVIIGVSAPFNFALTQSPTPPVSIITAGLIIIGPPDGTCPIPEPSTVALGLVGFVVAEMFRSRK
jgi:hypothetical protein